jgi:hypothetical protein
VLWKQGVAMDADLNNYDVEHVCTSHPKMTKLDWETIYREAWSLYYSPSHLKTLIRRAVATGLPLKSFVKVLVTFATTVKLENVHPLQGGIVRLKTPSERRPGLPREAPLLFWLRFGWTTVFKHAILVSTIARLMSTAIVVNYGQKAHAYSDRSLTPVGDDSDETDDLITKTTGGRAAVAHAKKIAMLTRTAG